MPSDDRTRWDARWSVRDEAPSAPSAFLDQIAARLPAASSGARVLDVAGGGGRNALWFARQAYEVTIADVSPVGLALAERRAGADGLTLRTAVCDLEQEGLPPGPYDVVVWIHFLGLERLTEVAAHLAPGGLLILEHPTTTNLERHERPSRRWLLEPGEVTSHLKGLEVLQYDEGWNESGRHEVRVVARRPRT